jgi:type IV secretion system protein VirD4
MEGFSTFGAISSSVGAISSLGDSFGGSPYGSSSLGDSATFFIFAIIRWVINMVMFAAAVGVAFFIRYRLADKEGKVPKDKMTLAEYAPKFLYRYKIRLTLATVLAMLNVWFWYWLLVLLTLMFTSQARKKKPLSLKEMRKLVKEANQEWLAKLGSTHAVRAARIEQIYSERKETVTANLLTEWERWPRQRQSDWSYVFGTASRSLATMDNREREHLRIVELLNSVTNGAEVGYCAWRFALIWGDGKAISAGSGYRGCAEENTKDAIQAVVKSKDLMVDQVISRLNTHLAEWRTAKGTSELKSVIDESFESLSQGGAGWLKSGKIKDTVFEQQSEHVLHIGSFDDGTPLSFSGEGSLISIAPPGSGKTQCNVFPNLLSWKGPAVVLDISGDIYEHTSRWRAKNVGPIYKFSPLEPESSHCYNPLTFVRNQPDYIWEDSRLLAEMMIVPSNSNDPFWENEARNALTASIAHVCYSNAPDQRPMHDVLDIMYGGEAWNNMILGLKMASDVRVMMQNANALAGINEKTLSSVLQTARSSLSAWTGERIARATKRSDWSPMDLRSGKNPTIYIYIRPNEVEAYLSLLRVFIGQHIRMLTGGAVPPRGSAPILFMLDELPRLRNMPPVDEALNIGRKYGLRLWLFAQSVGQLREAYKNADGMIGSCSVRIYMNVSGADGQSEKLSEEIGTVDSFTDRQKNRLVEAAELAGPAYRDYQIVFGLNAHPAKVRKDFAWKSEELKSRLGALESALAQ